MKVPRLEVINTGTELLLGQVLNTHLTFLAQSLFGLGLRVERQVTVPDGVAIAQALEESLARSEIVVITGGLGPTSDDITREAVAETLGRPLEFHPEILEAIANRFRLYKLPMNAEQQRPQALVPQGGIVLENKHGTAPGFIVETERHIVIVLPGPPRELRPLWSEQAIPWLRHKLADRVPPVHEITLRLLGLGETRVQEAVEAAIKELGLVEIGYCARPGEVDLRLIAGDRALVESAAQLAREKLGKFLYGEGATTLEQAVIGRARAAGRTVATAESCTGGLVAHRLTNVPHSSEAFRYGWVTYANEAKITELGVRPELLEAHGAVSAEVAQAMAEGARRRSGADLAVAITGIAGPTGGSAEKPVGLVYFALAQAGQATQVEEKTIQGEREVFKSRAAQTALNLLRQALPPLEKKNATGEGSCSFPLMSADGPSPRPGRPVGLTQT